MKQNAVHKTNPAVEIVEQPAVEELSALAKARLRRYDAADRAPRLSTQTSKRTERHLVAVHP